MDASVLAQIEELERLKTGALRTKYEELFGVKARSWNKRFLFRRVAWRLQARAEGDLSEGVLRRAAEIADDADLRVSAPRNFGVQFRRNPLSPSPLTIQRDSRLPKAGTVITRRYRGQDIIVRVGDDGFEYDGRRYGSLSAIARHVTGTRWNGLAFFHLTERQHA